MSLTAAEELDLLKTRNEISILYSEAAHGGPNRKEDLARFRAHLRELEDKRAFRDSVPATAEGVARVGRLR